MPTVELSAKALTFAYKGAPSPVLEDWSASFQGGEVVAITGPSGRGKSTLLYLLGLMLRPLSGQVVFDGLPASLHSDSARAAYRAKYFGFVFQDAALDQTRTVIDNVVEAALYRGDDRRSAIRSAEVLLDRLGVSTPSRSKPGQISGGQAARVALCRALLGNPLVVLADEPTGNLDAQSADVVLSELADRAAAGAAVVIVTHDPQVVERCDREVRL